MKEPKIITHETIPSCPCDICKKSKTVLFNLALNTNVNLCTECITKLYITVQDWENADA